LCSQNGIKKYKKYEELQKQIDEKLDDENKENR